MTKSKTCGFCNKPIAFPRGIDNYASPIAKYIWPVPYLDNPIVGKYACANCVPKQEKLQLELGLVVID